MHAVNICIICCNSFQRIMLGGLCGYLFVLDNVHYTGTGKIKRFHRESGGGLIRIHCMHTVNCLTLVIKGQANHLRN